jgi:hypothetical protein
MKYAIEMGSKARIYIPKFHTDCFRHSIIKRGGFTNTQIHRERGDLTSLLSLFQNKESSLKGQVILLDTCITNSL